MPDVPGYTALAVLAVLAVLGLERLQWHTGVLRTARYWQSLAIIAFFMVIVDGWLTRPGDPVVTYSPDAILGLRVPWDIPVEDYGFGWAMVTVTILLWEVRARREGPSGRGAAHHRVEVGGRQAARVHAGEELAPGAADQGR
jgi:lycopene cyclase domain-containing protein